MPEVLRFFHATPGFTEVRVVTQACPPVFQLTSGAVSRRLNGCVNALRARESKSKKKMLSAAKKEEKER